MLLDRVVYRSHATPLYTSGSKIADILAVAHRKNRAAGITGALAVTDDVFVQVIEGPSRQIDHLLATLAADPRHGTLSILGRWNTKDRIFGEWAMAPASLTHASSKTRRQFQADGLGFELISLLYLGAVAAEPMVF